MAARPSTGKKKTARNKASGKKASVKKAAARRKTTRRSQARKRLTPAREDQGLDASAVVITPDHPALAPLAAEIQDAGGAVIGAYQEPLSGKPLLLASLPRQAIEPTPFQRDLSPTHTKRLAAKIDEAGAFLDPLIVVRGAEGGFWTPNGRHRLAAAKVLGLKQITALVSPDEDLAFRILALNTEKAHNLKDRSLEVIRMARALAERSPRRKESEFSAEFEAPELLTLGIVYESEGRFAGGAYAPFLKKVDRFQDHTLRKGLREREGAAARLVSIDARVKEIIAGLQERGFKSPYLRNYVVARINPVRFHRAKKGETEPPMALLAGLTRMAASARKFDLASVRERDLALVAAVSSDS
ncbi:MAG: ParB N-terminal domain-containing protein [Myxococcota bacterium]|nr:ParB N-terminal domain-containing protein [Myxococcota bacterium]